MGTGLWGKAPVQDFLLFFSPGFGYEFPEKLRRYLSVPWLLRPCPAPQCLQRCIRLAEPCAHTVRGGRGVFVH